MPNREISLAFTDHTRTGNPRKKLYTPFEIYEKFPKVAGQRTRFEFLIIRQIKFYSWFSSFISVDQCLTRPSCNLK